MRVLAALLLLPLCGLSQARYELVLKGGHVIDPRNKRDGLFDIAVRQGRVAAVGPNLSGEREIDVSGLYVTPGLIDLHVHVFYNTAIPDAWAGDNSVQPDAFSFRTGVTTMVDAGSSGWRNFEAFRTTVIDRARTRVLAFINIAGYGMISDMVEQGDFDPAQVARLAKKHADVVVGVKTAHYRKPDWEAVDRAVEAGELSGLPVMVDFGYFLPERPFYRLVTERLRPGDIATHMFRAPVPWVDSSGKLYGYLGEARGRGVRFDVGHGGGSFVFRNAAPAIARGFFPDSISTDLHTGSMNAAMIDMPTTMSKMLALGMPLAEVIRASTSTPAEMIRRSDLGHLSEGAPADIAVWNLQKGRFRFADAAGGAVSGDARLFCELTLKAGQIVWDWNARAAVDYQKLGPVYGIRPGFDSILRPRR